MRLGRESGFPTVSRWFCSEARVAGMNSAHSWHTTLFVDMISRATGNALFSLPRSPFMGIDPTGGHRLRSFSLSCASFAPSCSEDVVAGVRDGHKPAKLALNVPAPEARAAATAVQEIRNSTIAASRTAQAGTLFDIDAWRVKAAGQPRQPAPSSCPSNAASLAFDGSRPNNFSWAYAAYARGDGVSSLGDF